MSIDNFNLKSKSSARVGVSSLSQFRFFEVENWEEFIDLLFLINYLPISLGLIILDM